MIADHDREWSWLIFLMASDHVIVSDRGSHSEQVIVSDRGSQKKWSVKALFFFFIAVKRVKKILKSNYQLTKKENNIFSFGFSLSCTCVENVFFTPCRIIIQAETIIFLKYTILPFKSINIFSIWKLAHCHSYLVANSRIPKCI